MFIQPYCPEGDRRFQDFKCKKKQDPQPRLTAGKDSANIGPKLAQRPFFFLVLAVGRGRETGAPQQERIDKATQGQPHQQPAPGQSQPEGKGHEQGGQERPQGIEGGGAGEDAVWRLGMGLHQHHVGRVRQRPGANAIEGKSEDEQEKGRGQAHHHHR